MFSQLGRQRRPNWENTFVPGSVAAHQSVRGGKRAFASSILAFALDDTIYYIAAQARRDVIQSAVERRTFGCCSCVRRSRAYKQPHIDYATIRNIQENHTMRYDITNIAIEDYLTNLMPEREPVLKQLEERALQHGLSLVGPVQGQFLYLQVLMMQAKKVAEIGITTGYAATYLMNALRQTGGHLTAVERHADRVELATQLVAEAGLSDYITIHQGEWLEILPTLDNDYDLVFLDVLRSAANEDQATQAFELCLPLLRSGGILMADNVLCSAQVLEAEAPPVVRGIQRMNKTLMTHPELESVILPIRDGVALCRKK
jgi:caffeoyl-CoA O-methyltransferase